MRADLAPAVLLGDRRDVEPRERAHVADRRARGGRDEHHDLLGRERDDHLAHARVGGPRGRVHLPEQLELPPEVRRHGRLGERVEVVGPAARRHLDDGRRRGAVGDGARLPGGLVEVRDRHVVGVGVAGPRAGLGADAGALAHVPRGFFDCPFFELQLFVDTILEVDVGIVDLAEEIRAEDAIEQGRRDVEAIGEEALRTCAGEIFHGFRRAPILSSVTARPQAFWRSHCTGSRKGNSGMPFNGFRAEPRPRAPVRPAPGRSGRSRGCAGARGGARGPARGRRRRRARGSAPPSPR